MSILNRASDGLLSVVLALRRAILAYGPLLEQDLLEIVAPRTVTPDGKSEMARMTLRRWKQLGFFAEHDGRISLESTVEEATLRRSRRFASRRTQTADVSGQQCGPVIQ